MKSGKLLSLEVFVCWPCEGLKTLPQYHTRLAAHVVLPDPQTGDCQLPSDERQKASRENKSLKCGLPETKKWIFACYSRSLWIFLGFSGVEGLSLVTDSASRGGRGGKRDEMLSSFSALSACVSVSVCVCVSVCVRPFDRTAADPSEIFINDPF